MFHSFSTFTRATSYTLVALFGMTALSLYYWFAAPVVIHAFVHLPASCRRRPQYLVVQSAIACLAVVSWFIGLRREREYTQIVSSAGVRRAGKLGQRGAAGHRAQRVGRRGFERSSGKRFAIRPEQSLLEALELAGVGIESGCRMGLCGADPICIVEGTET